MNKQSLIEQIIANDGIQTAGGESVSLAELRAGLGVIPVVFRSGGATTAPEPIPLWEVSAEEPAPLLLGRLDPADHTILFGTGGTGKGVVAAWWAARLVTESVLPPETPNVLIVDYEQHAKWEWRPRVLRFSSPKVMQDHIFIVQPDLPLWQEADRVADWCQELKIGYVVVDSVGFAVGSLDVSDSTTATKYSKAIQRFGPPVLSTAHTTKADDDPKYPFGSVYWHNGARVTMSLVGDGTEPRILTQKKTNQRGLFQPVQFDWSWSEIEGDGLPESLQETDKATTILDQFLEAAHLDWLTIPEALERMHSLGFDKVTEKSLRGSLDRDVKRPKGVERNIKREKVDGLWNYAQISAPLSRSG